MKRIVILISGRGSNMEALIAARDAGHLPVGIAAVISNRPDAGGLATAAAAGIATQVVDHKGFAGREAFDAALAECIDGFAPDLVVLAGFMRILSDGFVRHYAGRLVNIHPSLLPSFPGLHTHRRALDEGVRIHGCTVHFVTPALDHGPVIIQAAVPVLDDDSEETLAARVLAQEHRIYPQAVRWFAEDRLQLVDGRVRIAGAGDNGAVLIAPEVS
jgi:phosphoribosylglycinamide formyltransferase-1